MDQILLQTRDLVVDVQSLAEKLAAPRDQILLQTRDLVMDVRSLAEKLAAYN